MRLADEVNPLAGAPFYVNRTSAAMRAAQSANPPSPELTAIANTSQALTPSAATANTRSVDYALPRVTCVVWAAPEASR